MRNFYLLLFFLSLSFTVSAQLSQGGAPYSFSRALPEPAPVVKLPAVDVPALMAEDEVDLSYNLPLRFAFGHRVDLGLDNAGQWTDLPNGDRVWQLKLFCPTALNVNLLYDDFYLPPGARLYLYDETRTQVLGAFTSANNKAGGRFATALIHGESLTLEYYEPNRYKGQGRIHITQVAHGYRTMDGNDDPEKMSGDCQVDVNCDEGDNWQNEKKGVAKIVMDGLYLCSGTLVNNTANDCKPYFLTANHCLMGGVKQDAVINPDVSGYVFYWNFEVPECGAAGPVPDQTTTGGTVVANAGIQETGTHTLLSSDFALIQLDESPRGVYDVYFAGWDATGDPGNTGVGIHHPAGDVKKISTHDVVPTEEPYYWRLFWSPTKNGHSVTEGGSSGSALFRENGLIIGQLFGGSSVNCDDPANDVGLYGKLSYSWTNDDEPVLSGDPRRRLQDWLDPIGGGSIRTIHGDYDPCNVKLVHFKTTATAISEESVAATEGCRGYTDYTYELGISPYPRFPVEVTLSSAGTAGEGPGADYELLTSSVTFSNVINVRAFTLRVYNDDYAEAPESISVFADPGSANGEVVDLLPGADQLEITLNSGDQIPQNHVQTVRSEVNPAESYLGAFGTVYFTVPGSNGMLLSVDNQSGHDYGCVSVVVDNAGGTANNGWQNGSTVSKTYRIEVENPAAGSAPARIGVYFDDNEITAWEWFNNRGFDRGELQGLVFSGAAALANEATSSAFALTELAYGGDFRYEFSSDGFQSSIVGITLGNLGNVAQYGQNKEDFKVAGSNLNGKSGFDATAELTVYPTLVREVGQVRWTAASEHRQELVIVDANGAVVERRSVRAVTGINQLSLPVTELTAGTYWVRLTDAAGRSAQTRFIKY